MSDLTLTLTIVGSLLGLGVAVVVWAAARIAGESDERLGYKDGEG